MQKKIEWLIKILIGLSFAMPLILISSKFIFPFIVPKIVYFRSLVLLMLAGYVALLLINRERYRLNLSPINLAVIIFFLSFFISTFVGTDWYRSFWDNHERMLGLFTLFHYVLYYFIATSVVKGWQEWKWLLRFFLWAGSIVMFLGMIQKINPDFLLNRGSDRVSATLGNAIYFSAYGLFLLFIGCILFIKEKNKWWKLFSFVGATFGFLGIFWGGTRGTLLGLVAAIGTLMLCYFFSLEKTSKMKKIIGVVMVGGAIMIGILFIFRQTDLIRKIPTVGTLLNTSVTTGTAGTRIMAWQIAVEGWKDKPIFGWGPNNYYYAFNKYYNPKFLEHGWGETWFDNAHSALINTLTVQGIIGFLAYLALFGVPIFVLWRSYKRRNIDRHIASLGTAFLVGHFVHNAFVFENPTSYLYFFFFLACINQLVKESDLEKENKNKHAPSQIGSTLIFFLLSFLLIYSTDIKPAQANMATLKSIQSVYMNDPNTISLYQQASTISSPHIDDIRNDFARSCEQIISKLAEAGQKKAANDYFELSYGELEKNIKLHPLDIRVHISMSQLALANTAINQDASLIYQAEAVLEDALEKSPKRQQLIYMLAAVKTQLKKDQEAVDLIRRSIEDDPKINEGWWRLALAYKQSGDDEKATATIIEAKEKVVFNEKEEDIIKNVLNITLPEETPGTQD